MSLDEILRAGDENALQASPEAKLREKFSSRLSFREKVSPAMEKPTERGRAGGKHFGTRPKKPGDSWGKDSSQPGR